MLLYITYINHDFFGFIQVISQLMGFSTMVPPFGRGLEATG